MGEELIVKLIEFLESASPQVWAAAQAQVGINTTLARTWATIWFVVAGVLLILSIACLAKGVYEGYSNEDWYSGSVVSFIAAVIFALIGAERLTYLFRLTTNPNWYAIKLLARLVGGD